MRPFTSAAGRLAAVLLAAALIAAPLQAHEFLVKIADPNPEEGAELRAEIRNTVAVIAASDAATPPDDAEAVLVADGKTVPLALSVDEERLATKIGGVNSFPGTAWLAVRHKPLTWRQTPDGMAADSEGSAARSADRYEKFVKVLLNAGADDSVWAEKVGQLFEIVPDSNPYDLKAGDVVKVKAFYKDTPIVASWMAVRDGDEEQQSTHAAAALLAVADGHFFIADQPGLWVAIARVQIEEEEGGGLHYLTAALEFEVKP